MSRIAGAALTVALAVAAAVPAHAVGAASGWTEIRLSQSACISTAQRAVTGVGFEATADAQTVYGWRGEMVVVVRCIAPAAQDRQRQRQAHHDAGPQHPSPPIGPRGPTWKLRLNGRNRRNPAR